MLDFLVSQSIQALWQDFQARFSGKIIFRQDSFQARFSGKISRQDFQARFSGKILRQGSLDKLLGKILQQNGCVCLVLCLNELYVEIMGGKFFWLKFQVEIWLYSLGLGIWSLTMQIKSIFWEQSKSGTLGFWLSRTKLLRLAFILACLLLLLSTFRWLAALSIRSESWIFGFGLVLILVLARDSSWNSRLCLTLWCLSSGVL